MNGRILAWLFPSLLAAVLFITGYVASVVTDLDTRVRALEISMERNNTLLNLLEKRFLK